MRRYAHALPLGLCAAMLATPSARAGTITEFLDSIGGCRKPMSNSFSREVSPYTPKPYGKALADWTDQDLAEFRSYFLACQRRRPDWQQIGEFNRNYAIQEIDTALNELRFKVGRARSAAAQKREEAEGVEREAQAAEADRNEKQRSERERGLQIRSTLEVAIALVPRLDSLPPEQRVAQLDGVIGRMQLLAQRAQGAKVDGILANALQDITAQRDQIARRASAAAQPQQGLGNSAPATGPYTDYDWLGIEAIQAMSNPLQSQAFRDGLARGIDFNVGVSGIERFGQSWLVQLSGRLGAAGTPGQGFYCRVAGTDTQSLAILRTVTPRMAIIHVEANATDEYVLEVNPPFFRIVFSPCRVSTPHDGRSRPRDADAPKNEAPASQSREDQQPPIAPSPSDLRCTTNVLRRDHERVMAQRIRRGWAIPEALRGDPSLRLTFAITLDFDGRQTELPKLTRVQSDRASPEDMQAAVEAAHEAIKQTAPFPELGMFAGGTMQFDITPCD